MFFSGCFFRCIKIVSEKKEWQNDVSTSEWIGPIQFISIQFNFGAGLIITENETIESNEQKHKKGEEKEKELTKTSSPTTTTKRVSLAYRT